MAKIGRKHQFYTKSHITLDTVRRDLAEKETLMKNRTSEEARRKIAEFQDNLTAVEEDEFAYANVMQRILLLNTMKNEKFQYPDRYSGAVQVLHEQYKFLDKIQRDSVVETLEDKLKNYKLPSMEAY